MMSAWTMLHPARVLHSDPVRTLSFATYPFEDVADEGNGETSQAGRLVVSWIPSAGLIKMDVLSGRMLM